MEKRLFKDKDNLVILGVGYPDGVRKIKKSGKPNYTYHVIHYSDNLESVKDYELDLKDEFITDATVAINDKNQIVCAGLYSNKGFYNLTGCFYILIDGNSGKVLKSSKKEFSNEFNLSLMNKRQKRKAKKKVDKGEDIDAPQFDLKNLYIDDKGNALLIAEDYYAVQHCHTDSKGNTSCSYSYHFEDLIAVLIDNEGNIQWNIKIDKKLIYNNPPKRSFISIDAGDKFFFLYNENLDNLKSGKFDDDDDKKEKNAGRKNSAPILVSLDKNTGKYTKELLIMPDSKRSVILKPDFLLTRSDSEYYIKIDKDGDEYYYKLTINDKVK